MSASAVLRLSQIAGHLQPTDVSQSTVVPNGTAAVLSAQPLRVLITGAAGQIAYSLIHLVAGGDALGPQQKVILHLLDIPAMKEKLDGVVMEIEDCAYPLLDSVIAVTDERAAFRNVDIALLVGAMPRKPGMERKDLLQANAQIFRSMGKTINEVASKNIKVVVVGNPANTNALIAQTNAPTIPRENFTALTRLDQNRGRAQIGLKLKVPVTAVHNVIIWGNHSATQYPDLDHSHVDYSSPTRIVNTATAINDETWSRKTFIPVVQQRGAAVLAARKASSAMSAAKAISDHVHDWIIGTTENEIVSMGVASDGSYGIPKGIIFSFPVKCKSGTYSIVQGLELSPFAREMLAKTTKELLEEKEMASV